MNGRWNLSSSQCLYFALAVFVGNIAGQPCRGENAIYQALLEQGIKVSPQETLRLPKPILEDGATAAQHRAVIESLLGGRYDWETFTRKSVVAPLLLKISDGSGAGDKTTRRVDLYFVVYGSLKSLGREEYLQKQLNLAAANNEDDAAKVKVLSADDLRKRQIGMDQNAHGPRWVAVTSTLLGKVQISLTTKNQISKTAQSVLVASVADPTFERDVEFPNTWRAISIDDAGHKQIGAAQPYAGLGSYVKGTRLSEPAEAVFVEYHIAFIEPEGWFHGANLLRSKLPMVAQDMVRRLRRSLSN